MRLVVLVVVGGAIRRWGGRLRGREGRGAVRGRDGGGDGGGGGGGRRIYVRGHVGARGGRSFFRRGHVGARGGRSFFRRGHVGAQGFFRPRDDVRRGDVDNMGGFFSDHVVYNMEQYS